MYPILLEAGKIKLYTYGVFIAFAFIVSAEYCARVSRELKIEPHVILDFILWILISGLIGTRIAYIIFNIKDYIKEPVKILRIWEGGLAWYGGVIFSIIVGYIWTKKRKVNFLRMADITSLGLFIGLAIGRWGCFSAGCCYGRPTDFPLGVVFKNPLSLSIIGVKIHPTQIYEALGMFFFFAFIRGMMIAWKKLEEGKDASFKIKDILEGKTIFIFMVELLLVRLYYMWYGKGIVFPSLIDILFLPSFVFLFLFIEFLGFSYGRSRPYFEGIIFSMYFLFYGSLRFFLEFLRDPSGLSGFILDKTITANHLVSFVMFVFGAYSLVRGKFAFAK
jgi:phosphatidylglycerol:prolipoprotein diacylglycerol transferase